MTQNEIVSNSHIKQSGYFPIAFLFILAAVGVVISFNLLAAYSGKHAAMTESHWFCGVHQILDYGCSGVFSSRYGKLFGVPWPMLGCAYFLLINLWIIFFGRKTFNALFGLITIAGGAVTLSLLFILFFVLPGSCRWCLIIHGVNGLIVLVSLMMAMRLNAFRDFSQFRSQLIKGLLVFFIVASLGAGMGMFVFSTQMTHFKNLYLKVKLDQRYQTWLYSSQTPKNLYINGADHVLGNRAALVKIFVWKDFQCENCQQAWNILTNLYQKFKPNVCIILRHFPESNKCNPIWDIDSHPYACSAARALEAVGLTGGEDAFWKYNQLLHDNSLRLDKSPYIELAEKIGISRKSFLTALDDPRITSKIQDDSKELHELGLDGVPAIFINGRYVDGWLIKGYMEKLVTKELHPTSKPAEK
jgi:protein-disulfide isomerase/uncharacterized membrane protein